MFLIECNCGFCEKTFYTKDDYPERCPYCGSTSEVDVVPELVEVQVVEKKKKKK